MTAAATASAVGKCTTVPILEAKLIPPAPRTGTIPRTGLVNQLRVIRDAALTVLNAPAGYGKTTVLAEWARRDERPFAWLSVDEGDNDPVTLLTHLAVAFDRVQPLGEAVFDNLASARPPVGRVVAWLGRWLASSREPLVIVFDDVHHVTEPASIRVLSTLVAHLQGPSQLALGTRHEPALPLARLRAEGRLVEVGIDDLRLTAREASALLRAAGVDRSEDEVAELTRRTEGWPAGLYLAALSQRVPGARSKAWAVGADVFFSDYFRHEVLADLPDRDFEFLTRAAILETMCGPLCDAVLERSGSAAELEAVARSNLFLVPLDHERRWYRFHHLFRSMLRDELERREADAVPKLTARASAWFEASGDPDAAIHYAEAAGDRDRVAALVEAAAFRAYHTGGFEQVQRWLLPLDDDALLERHPPIAVIGAGIHLVGGHAAAAERWLSVADRCGSDTTMPDGSPLSGWRAVIHAAMCKDGVDRMRECAELAVTAVPHLSALTANGHLLLGVARLLADDDAASADSHFAEAFEIASSTGATDTACIALAERSLLAGARGDFRAEQALSEHARDAVKEAEIAGYGTSAITFAASARSALRHGNWTRSQDDMQHALDLLPQLTFTLPCLAVQVRLELARMQLALRDRSRAEALLMDVEAILARRSALGVLVAQTDELRASMAETRADSGWPSTLTGAELRLLPLLTTHLSFREIADRLYVSRNTVKTQAISVYRKLGVSSRSAAIECAVSLGLVDARSGNGAGELRESR